MRRIYFIRHAIPNFPGDEKYCIGQTDVPLGILGKMQCILLRHWLNDFVSDKKVFCSYLSRARETAEYLCENPTTVDGLEEMYAGEWDGLSFKEIQIRWPEFFCSRVKNENLPIPGAEDVNTGLERFIKAIQDCLDHSSGDIVIVAHSTVIQAILSYASSTPLNESRKYTLPYCSLSCLDYDNGFKLIFYGHRELPPIDNELYAKLLNAADGDKALLTRCLKKLEDF